MAPDTNGVHIEEEGFITPKKGMTLSSMSLFIWIITGVSFRFTCIGNLNFNYGTFCFITSLTLSIICGVYIVKQLIKKEAKFSTKIIVGVSNVLLLYTSANGLQAGYSAIDVASKEEVTCASIIPLMIAKSWLPDKFQASVISELEVKNTTLEKKVVELERYTADKSELIKELKKLKDSNKILADSLDIMKEKLSSTSDYLQIKDDLKKSLAANVELKNNVSDLKKRVDETSDYSTLKQQLEDLKNKNRNLISENSDLKNKLSENSAKAKELAIQNRNLNESVSELKAHLERLTQRINNNNSLQAKWQQTLAGNEKLMSMKRAIIEYFGADFYTNFFEKPISTE